ncbi:MAG: ABC transporter ATP-binding protein [Acholeplasmataceae bacterium]|nr:ABC transporter ATP-binding protein [Acholeplasmataceae bacterium]
MAFIELVDLDKRYHTKSNLVVNKLNLSIYKGEFLVFLGPSGCGKTTTIRMISGLEEISGGDILVNGKSIVHLPARDRKISMIFQSYAVWPHMTVYNNIAYPLKLRKLKKAEIDKRVRLVAQKTNISEYLHRYPTQLSGGQSQRVAVARAMVVEPEIFLMDEPLSNLDAMLRVSMRTELKSIHETLHATTIFVTHDQSEAMSLADRIVIMKDGLIEQIGTPKEVYFDCETVFVASFIGTPPTNFLDVEISKIDADLYVSSGQINYKLNKKFSKMLSAYVGKTVVMGVRPESFEIIQASSQDNKVFFECIADYVEPQGSHVIVVLSLNGNTIKISSPFLDTEAKTKIRVGLNEDRIMFFDKESQRRIREGQ